VTRDSATEAIERPKARTRIVQSIKEAIDFRLKLLDAAVTRPYL
jgi:hypothetical protein